jgi:ABC-type transporter Mla subunit MlaD
LTTPSAALPNGGRVVLPEPAGALPAVDVLAALRPPRPERPTLPPDVSERLKQFRSAAEAYLKQREELEKQLRGATEQQRQIIRERLKENLQKWREQARQFQDQAKDRSRELKRDLRSLSKALEEVRSGAVDSSPRPRPGIDR